ncbi:hypothetical protein A4X03_0g9073 [Tilletia caries]|uniref:Anti-silencing function protein 1 n=1 Tax=Tilletia caries TaxID=13290 RepID=A0A8T8SDN1_9BASI|nr:hypothetical protein A4X03_0g9073 [Tilletia caries]
MLSLHDPLQKHSLLNLTKPIPTTTVPIEVPFSAGGESYAYNLCNSLNEEAFASKFELTTRLSIVYLQTSLEPPAPSKIPETDLLGVTVILLTASYKDAEFIGVGYHVNNFLEKAYLESRPDLQEQVDDPNKALDLNKVDLDVTKLRREVLVFESWDFEDAAAVKSQARQLISSAMKGFMT